MPRDLFVGTFRSLWAGGIYVLSQVLVAQLTWGVKGWLDAKATPVALRVRYWSGWSFWGKCASLILTVAYLFVFLLDGTFLARDVGLKSVNEPRTWPWSLGLALGLAGWISLLWGIHWMKSGKIGEAETETVDQPPWTDVPFRVLVQEANAAILRATLIPFLGAYWGVWVGTFCKSFISYADPASRSGLGKPAQRSFIYLDWTLNWVSALFFVLSGSIWSALAARAICCTSAYVTYSCIHRRRTVGKDLLND